jgi:hypothetical protein
MLIVKHFPRPFGQSAYYYSIINSEGDAVSPPKKPAGYKPRINNEPGVQTKQKNVIVDLKTYKKRKTYNTW